MKSSSKDVRPAAPDCRRVLTETRFRPMQPLIQCSLFVLAIVSTVVVIMGFGITGQPLIRVKSGTNAPPGSSLSGPLALGRSCADQTAYCSRTDLEMAPLPDPIPNVGRLKGANKIVVPSDFHNPIVRVTDSQIEGPERANKAFDVSSSAEVHVISRNDDRIVISDQGTFMLPFVFDTATMQATRMYVSSFRSTNGMIFSGRSFPIWSYQLPYVLYQVQTNSANNPAIMQYDFTNTKKPPLPQLVVDLSSCVGRLAKDAKGWAADLTVSDDDQTFATSIALQGGSQGSAVVVIVWNRTKGCRVWETDTGQVTGVYGGAPTGTVNITDRFSIHNVRISKDGNWLKVVGQRCLSGACTTDRTRAAFWNIQTLAVNVARYSTPVSCGHGAAGFSHMVNSCGGNGYGSQAFWIRAFTDVDSVKILNPAEPRSRYPFDLHISWTNADPDDTSPFFSSTWIGQLQPNYAWDNEIIAVSADGSGTVHRFAHNFITGKSNFFSSKYGIGTVSQDAKWFIWSSDWAGALGNVNLRSDDCTVGINCRADVFMVKLQ